MIKNRNKNTICRDDKIEHIETVLCWSEDVVIHFRCHVSDVADGLDEAL